jgi:hypothetical protein
MRRGATTWSIVGLVALAVVAVVVAVAALRSTSGSPRPPAAGPTTVAGTGQAGGSASGGTSGGSGDDEDGGGSGSNGGLADALPGSAQPPMLLVSPALAYRAKTGSCLGGAALERSTSGGKRWTPLVSPAAAVLALSSSGGDAVTLVGADNSCQVRVWTSSDQGATWSAPSAPSGVFVQVPDDASTLLTPTGSVRSPCPGPDRSPISVAGISPTEAALLCRTGDVLVTQNGGRSWTTQSPVVGGATMAFGSPSLGWALRLNSGQCPSYQLMRTQDAARTWQTGGCLGVDPVKDTAGPGSIAFADSDVGIADLAGAIYATDDSGLTWQGPR